MRKHAGRCGSGEHGNGGSSGGRAADKSKDQDSSRVAWRVILRFMSITLTELELFYRFLGDQIGNGGRDLDLDAAVKAFRAYQEQLARLRREIQPALEGSLRGECQPFDAEALKQRISEQLARRGIAE